MEYRVLGQLMVLHDGVELPLRAGRPKALLLWLLLARGDVLPAELLQDRLWVEAETPANPQNALQTQVSYLRRVFAMTGEQPIQTRGGGYCLRFDPGDVDAFRFERLLGDARHALGRRDEPGALAQAAGTLGEALSLWRGHPLVELSGSEDVVSEVVRLEEMHLAALELRAEVTLELGRTDDALAQLRGLVAEHPLRERLHELLMVALYRSGRQGEALLAYQHVRDVLIDELGIEPGPGLVSMQQRVLNHDQSLGEPSSTLRVAAAPPSAPAHADAQVAGVPPLLPAELTMMVGRDEDVAAVSELLAAHRLVTLLGPGGVGKTRVAVAVARRQTPQPVWFVDLAPVDSDDKVAAAVATVLGVTTRPDVHPADAITAETPRTGLLLLDTCERVVAGVAELVPRMLAAWPDLRVLATSRRPLHIAGELIRPVPPLSMPSPDVTSAESAGSYPAVQLFLQRAAAVRPDVDLAGTALEVAALCRALDGLPLAIELAAAQVDVLGPAAIHRHLTERFELLVDESRGAEGRHSGLRTTIDWSVQLLTEEQRRFFARLAVFPASFDVGAAASVTGYSQGRAIRLLAAVVRNSLVRPAGEDRFVLLDSLHDYAADLLDDDADRADVAARHASFYAEQAREAERHVRSPDQQTWWARLRADLPNFRAALEWSFSQGDARLGAPMAASLTWVLIHDGMLGEADRWLRHAAKVDGLDASTRAQVLIHVAMLSSAIGRFQVALLTATEALELARTASDPVAAGAALSERGIAEWALGDLAASAHTHDETIEILSAAGEHWGAALAMLFRARTAVDAADPEAADLAARALRAAQATGDRALTGVALQQVALLALLRSDLDEAARAAEESLVLVQALAYQEGIAGAVHLQGRIALARNEPAKAYQLFRQTLASGHRMGHVAIICQSLESIATALMAFGAVEQSGGLLELASRTREVRRMPARTIEAAWADELRVQLGQLGGQHRARTYLDVDDALRELPQSLPQQPVEPRARRTGSSTDVRERRSTAEPAERQEQLGRA